MTKLPPIKMDWSVNLSHLGSMILFIFACVGGYYDLKSEVARNKDTSELRFAQIEKGLATQSEVDKAQDMTTRAAMSDLKDNLRDQSREIKQDIRDLRSDLIKSPALRR